MTVTAQTGKSLAHNRKAGEKAGGLKQGAPPSRLWHDAAEGSGKTRLGSQTGEQVPGAKKRKPPDGAQGQAEPVRQDLPPQSAPTCQ
jgi:hypothetical protein